MNIDAKKITKGLNIYIRVELELEVPVPDNYVCTVNNTEYVKNEIVSAIKRLIY